MIISYEIFGPRQSRLFLRRSSTNYLFVVVNSTSYARAKNLVQGFPEATRQANKNGESSNS